MLLSLTVSLLPLVAVSVSAAPAPAPATSSANYGNLPAGWQSASDSLIMDNINSQRVLTGQNQGGSTYAASPEKCAQFCESQGWPLAGVEYGGECFCGTELKNGGSLNTLNYREIMPCSSDSSLNCGGPNGINLFYDSRVVMKGSSGNFELLADPTKQNNGFVATNLCLKETGDGSARLFNGPSLRADDMTSAKCTDFCDSLGFKQAGIEYASECYCSNNVNLATVKRAENCNMACRGRKTETCGGPDALTVYQKVVSTTTDPTPEPAPVEPEPATEEEPEPATIDPVQPKPAPVDAVPVAPTCTPASCPLMPWYGRTLAPSTCTIDSEDNNLVTCIYPFKIDDRDVENSCVYDGSNGQWLRMYSSFYSECAAKRSP